MTHEKLKEDETFIEFIEDRKGISEHRKNSYIVSLSQFFEVVDKTPTEYIKETKMKQVSYLEEREIITENNEKKVVQAHIEPDIEKGDLYRDFKKFYSFLEEKKLSDRTKDDYIANVRTFLSKNGVKLPEKIKIDIITNPKKILKREKIIRAINKASPRNKAIFSFMASAGLRSKDVRNLKIKDLLKALELENIEELFNLEDNRIGYFEFKPNKTKKKGFWCKTCCTPDSIKLIVDYLKYERKRGEINHNSYLFTPKNKNKGLSRNGFKGIFQRMDKKLYAEDLKWFKDQLNEGKVSKEKYDEEIIDISKFHAHGLRAYFINTISSYCGNLKVVTAMEGHKSPVDTDNSYTNFNRGVIVQHYLPIVPYLSIEKTIINVLNEERIDKYEKKLEDLAKIAKEANERAEKEQSNQIKLNTELSEVKEILNKHSQMIKSADELSEALKFSQKVIEDETLSKIEKYARENFEGKYDNLDFFSKLNILNKEKDLSKMKEKEWKKEVDKIIAEISTSK